MSSVEFGLAPYPKMLVLGLVVTWQSFMLYHKSEQFWSITARLLRIKQGKKKKNENDTIRNRTLTSYAFINQKPNKQTSHE